MNNESNYGINTLTLDKINYLTNGSLSYYGPVIEKNGRFYITTINENSECNIIAVLDKSISVDEAERITDEIYDKNIRKPEKINYGNTGFNPDNIDELDNYITNIESKLGNKIGHVDLHDDKKISIYNYDGSEVISDTEIKKVDENNYDLNDFENNQQPIYYGSDIVNSESIKILNEYAKELSGLEDAEIIFDEENDIYVVKSQDKVLLAFKKDATIAEVTSIMNETFKEKKSLGKLSPNQLTNKLESKENDYSVYINVNDYESVQGKLNNAKSSVSEGSSSYKPGCLSGKLQAHFTSLVGDANPKTKLMAAENLIDTLKSNINYSISAYENIGGKLGVIINSVIDEIFSMNRYNDKITSEYYSTTLEEREEAIEKIINDLSTRLTTLKEEYNDVVSLIEGVGYAFGLFTEISDSNFYNNRNNIKYNEILDFMFENDVISKLKSYASGADWETSGLADLYNEKYIGNIATRLNNFEEAGLSSLYNERYIGTVDPDSPELNENNFLSRYLYLQKYDDNSDVKLKSLRSITRMGIIRIKDFPEDYQALKDHILKQINTFNVDSKLDCTDENGNKINLSVSDKTTICLAHINSYNEAIYTASETIYNYNQYKNLMKYEPDMKGNLYLEYLTQDWGSYDFSYTDISGKVKYMDQSEIALYCMYSGIPLKNKTNFDISNNSVNPELAEEYIEALDDVINRRQGLEEAILRYEGFTSSTLPEALFDASKYGFSDGVEGFLSGLANVFLADGKRSVSDYRNMFILNLLSDDKDKILGDKYHLDDLNPVYREILKKDYIIFKGIGTMIIPTAVSFLPVAGKTASIATKLLYGGYILGSQAETAMQSGASGVSAYLYGGVSALSSLALNKLMSGIAGLNGQLPKKGIMNDLNAMMMQSGRAITGVYVDSVWRSVILGQPIDLSTVSEAATQSAIDGMLIAAGLNGITKCAFKFADGFVYKYSDKYNTYEEMLKDLHSQFKNSKECNRLAVLKKAGGKAWDMEKARLGNTMIGKWLDDLTDPSKDSLMDLTDQADSLFKSNDVLGDNEILIFDNNSKGYYIANRANGNVMRVPPSWLSNHDPGPIDSNLNYYTGLGTGNGYFLGDGSDMPPTPMPTPDSISEKDIMLVRSTSVLPKDGEIRYIHQDVDKDNRHTIHFTCNGLVNGDFIGAGDWKENPFVILEPFKYHVNESLRGGFAGDVYYNDTMKLSNEAIILVKKEWYDRFKDTLPKGYNYRTFSGDPNDAVSTTLKSLGYYAGNASTAPATKVMGNTTEEQVKFESAVQTLLNRLKGNGMSSILPGVVHSGSQDFEYEKTMNDSRYMLAEERGQNVRLGDEDVLLSDAEAIKLLSVAKGETSPELFKETMLNKGVAYDEATGQFRIVNYNEYMNRAHGRGIATTDLSDRSASSVTDKEINSAYNKYRAITTPQDEKLKTIQNALGSNYKVEVTSDGKVSIKPINALSVIDEDTLEKTDLSRKEARLITSNTEPVTFDLDKLFSLDEKEQQSLVEKQIKPQVEKELDNVMLKRQGEVPTLSNDTLKGLVSLNDVKATLSNYDSLPTTYRIQLLTELLEKSASSKGLTLKDLASLSKDEIVDPKDLNDAKASAASIRSKAEQVEPQITSLLQSLEDDDSILIGLEHKLKGYDSIVRKLILDHNHAGVSIDDAAARLGDSVRYTMIIDPNRYTEKSMDILKQLQDNGFTVKVATNSWGSSLYKGLNTSIISPDGTKFEIQFHTPDSYIIKDCDTHLFYEIRRNEYVDSNDKDLAKEIQKLYTSTIPVPKDIVGTNYLDALKDNIPNSTKAEKFGGELKAYTSGINANFTLEEAANFLKYDQNGKVDGYKFDVEGFNKFLRDNNRYNKEVVYSSDNLPSTAGSVQLTKNASYVVLPNDHKLVDYQETGKVIPCEVPNAKYIIVSAKDIGNIKTTDGFNAQPITIESDASKIMYSNGQPTVEKVSIISQGTIDKLIEDSLLDDPSKNTKLDEEYRLVLVDDKYFSNTGSNTVTGKDGREYKYVDVEFNDELVKQVPAGAEVTNLRVIAGPGSPVAYRGAGSYKAEGEKTIVQGYPPNFEQEKDTYKVLEETPGGKILSNGKYTYYEGYADNPMFVSDNPNGYYKVEGQIESSMYKDPTGNTDPNTAQKIYYTIHYTVDEYGNIYSFETDFPKIKESSYPRNINQINKGK